MASAATGGQGEESADPHIPGVLYGCENKGVAGEAIRIVMKAKGEQKRRLHKSGRAQQGSGGPGITE